MITLVDVIFAINDPLKGPNTIFYESTESKDQNLTLKVPVKAQLTLSLMDMDAKIQTADAVLPFPDLQKTAFSLLFTLNSESSGKITGSISYLVPQTENINLYKKIPELKEKINYIVRQLQGWNYKFENSLPKNYADLLSGILLFENDQSYKTTDISSLITSDKSTGAPDYLIKKINKNLEHLFFELYVGRPVIVIGKSKIAAEYAMATFDFLTPQKTLRKVIFTEDYIDPANYLDKVDVIGVSSNHEKKYKDYLIVDVDKFEIKNCKGKKLYFKSFMEEMIRMPVSMAVKNIAQFINHLDDLTTQLYDMMKKGYSEIEVKRFLKTLSYNEATALNDIEIALHSTAAKGFTQQLSHLASWIEDLR